MSGAALTARTQYERARVAIGADALAVGFVSAVVGALLIATWGAWGDLDSDTGYDLVAAHRLAEGDLIYRDFVYFYGPLGPALLALVAVFGGADFGTALAVGLPIAIAIVALTFAVGRALVGPIGAAIAATLTAALAFNVDNYSYVIPHTTDMTVGMALVLTVLLAVLRYAATLHSRWLALTGFALGLLSLTKPEPALAAGAAVAIWLLLRARYGALPRREVALVLAPAVLVATFVYGTLLLLVSPRRLFLENLYPVDYLEAAGDVELHNRMPLSLDSFVDLGAKLALYAVGIAALLGVARAIDAHGRLRAVALGLLGVVAAGALATSLARPEALRHGLEFAYGWIPAAAAIAFGAALVQTVRRRRGWTPVDQLALVGLVALTILAATVYVGFFPHAPHEQMAAYYMPLAALFLTRLHLVELGRTRTLFALGAVWLAFLAVAGVGLAVKDVRAETATVEGRGGSIAENPAEAGLYAEAVEWIDSQTTPGEPIFVAPMMTGLYPLSQHWGPVDAISMLPGALPTPDDERRAIAALDEAGVRVVLTDDRTWPGYNHGSFGETFATTLAKWIADNYRRSATFSVPAHDSFEGAKPQRTLTLWLRRTA